MFLYNTNTGTVAGSWICPEAYRGMYGLYVDIVGNDDIEEVLRLQNTATNGTVCSLRVKDLVSNIR